MTITVQAPNGSSVQFPDGTDGATIDKVMSENFGGGSGALADAGKGALTGLAEGTISLGSIGGDLREAALGATEYLTGKIVGPEKAAEAANLMRPVAQIIPQFSGKTSAENKELVEGLTGKFYEPQTFGGKVARTTAAIAPAAAFGPGSIPAKAASALTSGAGTELAGSAAEAIDPSLEPYARIAGGVAGAFVPAALRRAVTPLPISQERQASINALRNEGVELTAGQASGSKGLQYLEAELGGGTAQRAMERQGEQFTRAALGRVGENANRATPEVVDQAFTRIGQQFDDLAARHALRGDAALGNTLSRVEREYHSVVNPSQRAPVVADTIRDIGDAIAGNRGVLPGDAYQALRSRLDRLQRGSRDNELSEALRGIRNALDNAMERTIAATDPADLGAWRQARNQYRNMLVIERSANAAGENAAAGILSPKQIKAGVKAQNARDYARGRGDFAELARTGEELLSPLPNSGTAGRNRAQNLGAGIASTMGAIGGTTAGGPLGGILGAAAGAALPYAAGRALMSRPVQGYLSNQAAAGLDMTDPRVLALLGIGLPQIQYRPQ